MGSFSPEIKRGADSRAVHETEKVRLQLEGIGVGEQGLRAVTHLDARLTLDTWRP